jgi:hypothetical protein
MIRKVRWRQFWSHSTPTAVHRYDTEDASKIGGEHDGQNRRAGWRKTLCGKFFNVGDDSPSGEVLFDERAAGYECRRCRVIAGRREQEAAGRTLELEGRGRDGHGRAA